MNPLSPHSLLLTAACDEVVSATRAFTILRQDGAPLPTLRAAEQRQSDAIHYVNILTRKIAEVVS